jgi:hypothetical protein
MTDESAGWNPGSLDKHDGVDITKKVSIAFDVALSIWLIQRPIFRTISITGPYLMAGLTLARKFKLRHTRLGLLLSTFQFVLFNPKFSD